MNGSWYTRSLARRAVDWAIVAVVVVVALFPMAWGLSTSFKSASAILQYPPEFIPSQPTLEHYRTLVETGIGR